MADTQQRIAEIRDILHAGVTEVMTDGTTVKYDLAALRRELRQLEADNDRANRRAIKRPRFSSINLSNH